MLSDFKQINTDNLTSPLLKEYIGFKEENPDAILLFQIGEFWETFFQDAKDFAEITGVTLSARKIRDIGEILQAGIPASSLDLYIKKLLSNNRKVCLCTEFQNEKKEFHRRITRTYTKGTIIENEFLESTENNFIASILKKRKCILFSYADVSTGQFYKTKGSLEEIYSEIEKIEPDELLILNSQKKFFKEIIPKHNVTILKDKDYKGEDNPENILVKYCIYNQKEYTVELDKIIEYSPSDYLAMDEITRSNLELTRTRRYLKKKGSLVWFLNYTKTPMGSRLLKKYIGEPLLNIEKIRRRQDAVGELIFNESCLSELEENLEQFCDLSRMCAKISNSTISPKDLYQIVSNSNSLKRLYEICKSYKSKLLKVDEGRLKETIKLADDIKSAINENSNSQITSGGVINTGYNSNLDYLRAKLSKLNADLDKYEQHEKRRLDTNQLKIDLSRVLGYYIEIPITKAASVPNDYYKKQALSNCARYSTDILKEFEEKIFNLKFQINQMEYLIYCDVRKNAAEFVEIIRKLAEDIARIDVLVSFSRAAITNGLTRPEFNNKKIFIKDGFHPSLIKLNNEVTKNDTNLSNGSIIVLTGANMSGKSTYLKYNAIICLLSQIGSYIPAQSADLTIVDKIFVRQGSTDDIINNNSSFMVEMNDLKFIIDNITDNSFVALDEPAKSTNADEGGAIARAFCEYILSKYNAKIILATHNLELTKLEDRFPDRAFNYVIGESEISQAKINDRKIRRGIISSSLAINTAILAQLPQEIIDDAKKYLNKKETF